MRIPYLVERVCGYTYNQNKRYTVINDKINNITRRESDGYSKDSKDSILSALKFLDEHGIPDKHKSTQYELISSDDKKYPPKYVIAVANHIENGGEIVTTGYNAVEAKNYFESHGFKIQDETRKK